MAEAAAGAVAATSVPLSEPTAANVSSASLSSQRKPISETGPTVWRPNAMFSPVLHPPGTIPPPVPPARRVNNESVDDSDLGRIKQPRDVKFHLTSKRRHPAHANANLPPRNPLNPSYQLPSFVPDVAPAAKVGTPSFCSCIGSNALTSPIAVNIQGQGAQYISTLSAASCYFFYFGCSLFATP